MEKVLLVAGHEQRNHSQRRALEPGFDVAADILPLSRNVRRHQDMLDAELSAQARLIAAAEIGEHAPIVWVGDRIEPEFRREDVNPVAAAPAAADRNEAVRRAAAAAIRLDDLAQGVE